MFSNIVDYKTDSSSASRHCKNTRDERLHVKSMLPVDPKVQPPRNSCSRVEDKADFPRSSKRSGVEHGKESRSNGTAFSRHRKGGFLSAEKRHSSTDVAGHRFSDVVDGKRLLASDRHGAPHNRGSSGSRKKYFGLSTEDIEFDSPLFREHASNSSSKQRMDEKLRWINCLPRSGHLLVAGSDEEASANDRLYRKPRKKKLQFVAKDKGTYCCTFC